MMWKFTGILCFFVVNLFALNDNEFSTLQYIEEENYKTARRIFYSDFRNDSLNEIIKHGMDFRKMLKFVAKNLKQQDVCRGLELMYKELHDDPWNSILLASEVYQSKCYDLWLLTIRFKMNELTKWMSDEVCLQNKFYKEYFLYPFERNSTNPTALIRKMDRVSDNRKHWVLLPNYDRPFTYRIYNQRFKGFLATDPTKIGNRRTTLMTSDPSQLWTLNFLTNDEIQIESVDFDESLYAFRGDLGSADIETFTRKLTWHLGDKAEWRLSFYCHDS